MAAPQFLPRALMPMLLTLLVSACAQPSTVIAPPPAPPKVPSLPSEARVSSIPIPPICQPSCSQGIQRSLSRSADLLTNSVPTD